MSQAPPIGVFDSGVGGLTVLRELRAALPAENFLYLGDTARLPYGTKSAATVARYSVQCAAALIDRGIRFLVVACNTASASALETLRLNYPQVPCFGVIEASAAAAVAVSRSQHIAVIATEGTIEGGAYQEAIRRLNPGSRITARACSLFVALAEEGWVEGAIAESIARRYLDPIFATSSAPDTLVLGCTHFPALIEPIRAAIPDDVRIVDSAATTAACVAAELSQRPSGSQASPVLQPSGESQRAPTARAGAVRWLATDGAARFARVSSTFLGTAVRSEDIEIIDLPRAPETRYGSF